MSWVEKNRKINNRGGRLFGTREYSKLIGGGGVPGQVETLNNQYIKINRESKVNHSKSSWLNMRLRS